MLRTKEIYATNQPCELSQFEMEHFNSFNNPSNDTLVESDSLIPQWLNNVLNEITMRDNIQTIDNDINDELKVYDKWTNLKNRGLGNYELNEEFRVFSGSSLTKNK